MIWLYKAMTEPCNSSSGSYKLIAIKIKEKIFKVHCLYTYIHTYTYFSFISKIEKRKGEKT